MSDFGLKISLPGYDVKSAAPEQCAVHSSYPPLKAKTNQTPKHIATLNVDFTSTITQASVQTLYAINHGYGYIPFTLANIKFIDSGGGENLGIGSVQIGASLDIQAFCTGSQFQVTIYDDFNWTSSAASLEVSYYIFAENGT